MTPVKPTAIEFAKDLLGLAYSTPQEALLRAIYGLPLADDQRDAWRVCTGRAEYPGRPFSEVTVIAGARGGKDSRIAAPIVCYEAIYGEHEQFLGRGDIAMIPLFAQDARATRVAFGLIRDYITCSRSLSALIDRDGVRESSIRLRNRVWIECFASTAKSGRGYSIPAAVMDELAFFRIEAGANADWEIQTALRRGMITFPSRRLVKISTPYLRGGVLYEDFRTYWGQDQGDVLVWRAPSAVMNPSLSRDELDKMRRLDPLNYAREYEAEFGAGAAGAIPPAWIEAAVVADRHHLPPRAACRYVAAVDPTGGGADAFTLAIVHLEDDQIVLDVLLGWAGSRSAKVPLQAVVQQGAEMLRAYGVAEVVGDRYGGEWPAQEFQRHGVYYRPAEGDKAHAYTELAALLAQGRVALLDHPDLIRELKALERHDLAGGKPRIEHPKGGHDDYANATALAVAEAARGMTWVGERPLHDLTLLGPPPTTSARGFDWGPAAGGERWEW